MNLYFETSNIIYKLLILWYNYTINPNDFTFILHLNYINLILTNKKEWYSINIKEKDGNKKWKK